MRLVYFITHPEVVIDPNVPVPEWPLSVKGRERMRGLLSYSWVATVTSVYSSEEQKARDGALILAEHLGLPVQYRATLGENDRSSTGFLPSQEFEATADLFFAHPEESIHGWETASGAQQRIVSAVDLLLAQDTSEGSVALVSHGGVGTLLLCHLLGIPITRAQDQPGSGGGNYYVFTAESRSVLHGWRTIDAGV